MKNILGETQLQDTTNKKDSTTLLNESNYYCAYNPNLYKKQHNTVISNTLKVKDYQRP